MKVEELAQAEKEQRKQRVKTRMLYVLVGIDVLLLGYAILEIIALVVELAAK